MKKTGILCLGLTICLVTGVWAAQVPYQVGGFTLGKAISEHPDLLKMETALPIRYMEYIKEVEISDIPGFKSGLIGYGDCFKPGRIVRIKLKYSDSSKKFFNSLLKHFKERFGEPEEWRGDPFHMVVAWKWSFIDSKNNRISLTLQHNTKDEEEKIGNAVKLTMTNFLDEEQNCFEKKHPESRGSSGKKAKGKKTEPSKNWDLFIPR